MQSLDFASHNEQTNASLVRNEVRRRSAINAVHATCDVRVVAATPNNESISFDIVHL